MQSTAANQLPELLRRKDVLLLTGWSVWDYYQSTDGLRVRGFGYKEERLPKSELLLLIQHNL